MVDTKTTVTLAEVAPPSVKPGNGTALNLRKAILSHFKNDIDELKSVYNSISNGTDDVDEATFREFAEEMLGEVISAEEGKALYNLYGNGDGTLSRDDFLTFVSASAVTVSKALNAGNGDVIIDIRVSTNAQQDAVFVRQGYIQVLPEATHMQGRYAMAPANGSFGRGQNMWIWKKKLGTCSGRLKPIVDVQLEQSSISSAMVISGYTCLNVPISGQYLWIKRAKTAEEELDSIVDFQVTVGKMKIPSDKIWSSPGVGWIRVDSNFNRGIFTQYDSFLWFRPSRSRSLENHLSSPLRYRPVRFLRCVYAMPHLFPLLLCRACLQRGHPLVGGNATHEPVVECEDGAAKLHPCRRNEAAGKLFNIRRRGRFRRRREELFGRCEFRLRLRISHGNCHRPRLVHVICSHVSL